MDRPLSRLMGLATSAYGVYAIVRPGHLAQAMKAPPGERHGLEVLARTYGVRDLATSSLLLSSDPSRARAAMALRIASDVGDCVLLLAKTSDPAVRRKVAAATLGWATLNAAAWWADERS